MRPLLETVLVIIAVACAGAAVAGDEALGKIEAAKPKYRARKHASWAEKGRIVGHMRQPPVAEIDVLGADDKVVLSVRVKEGQKAYEIEWLAPGVYTLRVSAAGYQQLVVPKLEVRAKHDLFVNLEFTPAE